MKLVGLDYETSGLDPEKDRVIEVGVVLWDTDHSGPVLLDNFLVAHPLVEVTDEITKITSIRQRDITMYGLDQEIAFHRMMETISLGDAIVCHNGNLFDRLFYKAWATRILGQNSVVAENKIWVDTQIDIDYPESIPTRKLTYLAAEHGFLNPFAHRAVFDVLTMLVVLSRYNIEEVLYSAQQPTITIQAQVSFDEKQKAKDVGFYWNPDRKMWLKSVKEHKYNRGSFLFPTRIVNV